jgi:hypothetical protein
MSVVSLFDRGEERVGVRMENRGLLEHEHMFARPERAFQGPFREWS